MFCPPALLVLDSIVAKGGVVGFGGNPEDHVAVVAGRGQELTLSD